MDFRTRHNLSRTMIVLVAVTNVLGANLRSSHSSEHDEQLINGLLQRSLFSQARLLCQDAILTHSDNAQQKADWYGFLFQTYAKQFLDASPDQQTAILAEATRDWQNFVTDDQLRTSRPDVELNYLLIGLAEGELLSLASSYSQDVELRQRAIRQLKSVSVSFEKLRESVAILQRTVASKRQLSDLQLRQLLYQTQFKLGESLKRQALIFPKGSPDQVHLLSEAQQQFNSMGRLSGTSALKSRSQLAEIECQLRLGNLDQARESIDRIERDTLSPELKGEFELLQAELLIEQARPQTAVEQIQQRLLKGRTELSAATHAKAELTLLRAFLAIAREATEKNDTAGAKQYQTLAVNLVRQMEQDHSSYWVAIANRELTGLSPGNAHFSDLEVLNRAAATQYQQGRTREASATYRKAANLAEELSDVSRAFELRLRAAAIELQEKDYEAAGAAFRELALSAPQHRRASEAHLLAINAAAHLARESSDAMQAYESLLQEHVHQWTTGPSANTARQRLGQLHFARGRRVDAINTWILINNSFPQIAAVRDDLNRCFEMILSDPSLAATTRNQIAHRATHYFLTAVENERALQNDDWTVQSRELLTRHAKFQLFHSPDTSRPLLRLLQSAEASPQKSPVETAQLKSLIGLNQALLGQFKEASATFNEVDWSLVIWPIQILGRLDKAAQAPRQSDGPIPRIMLQLNKSIVESVDTLSNDDENNRARYEAGALKQTGNRQAAIEIYNHLATRQPRNVLILMELAQLLASDASEGSQKSALKTWRTIARLTPAGSLNWLEAKLGIAHALWELGDHDRAREVAKLTTVLHPEISNPRLKRGFELLLERSPAP